MGDFVVEIHGSVWIIHARSPEAKHLVENEVSMDDWQPFGGSVHSFVADHRPAGHFVEAMYERGFSVSR